MQQSKLLGKWMIQEQFNYIRITYSRDLAEAEGFAWYEAPEKPLNRNTVFFLSHGVWSSSCYLVFVFFQQSKLLEDTKKSESQLHF